MYLAEHTIKGRKRYIIRDSLYNQDTKCWQSRDLFDLGWSPWEYIEYPGGNAFCIKESVCDELAAHGVQYDLCELEELLWRFIRKDIRLKIEPFYRRGRRKGQKKIVLSGVEQQFHIFDKRRLYYLRCGVTDQCGVDRLPLKFFKGLLHKSRDEIEQYILQLEKSLHAREYKLYAFVIFDLQRYFRGSPARRIPQALDQDELDRYFIKDLCRLNENKSLWGGFKKKGGLHDYLVRYAVMFFDYEFDGRSTWNEYLQNFINSRRFYRPPSAQIKIAITEIVEIFGVAEEQLLTMKKSELTKLFRRKAHELHPDKGGEHEAFVRLAAAYKELLRKKG